MSGAPPSGHGRVTRGILRIGTFKADGMAEFSATPQAFLNSLAPLLALPVVGGLIMLGRGHVAEALASVLANLVILLAPPVAAHAVARWWGREALWLRYAVAYNWCQWAVALALLVAMVGGGILVAIGLPDMAVAQLAMLALAGYGIALNWFLARTALQLSGGRAALFIFMVWLAAMVLIMVPVVLTAMQQGIGLSGLPA
jgi:hypothetical protein